MRLIYAARPEPDDPPEAAAAAWFSLLLSGDASEADQQAIAAWRAARTEHAEAWDKIATIWDYSPVESEVAEIRVMREAALARPQKSRRPWFPIALAASFAIALVGTGLYTGGVIPGLDSGSGGRARIAVATRDVSTGVGQQQLIDLDDGSRITINTASAARIAYSAEVRNINLARGEAFFHVAKDPQRPFVVAASGLTVTAVGTQFSVRVKEGEVDVVLAEGHVRVERGGGATLQSVTLAPGERLRATAIGFDVSRVDALKTTNWTTGHLSFEQTPLREAIGEVNRYSTHPIVLADQSLGSIPVTGQFAISRPDDFILLLNATGMVRSTLQADGSLKVQSVR